RAQPKPPAAPPSPAWTYLIESVALENTEALLDDVSTGRHVKLAISPLNVHVKGVSSDQRKPLTFDLATNVNTRGKLALAGTATIEPLKAEVKINTDRLDLAALDPFISQNLNATITSALLNMKGDVGVSNARNVIRASYRGDVGIARLRMLDKLTGEDFAHWDELNFRRIDFAYGEQKPKVHVGSIALSDFYARIILNKDGKLNLNDITTNPNQAPTSLTQPKQAAAASATPAPTPAAQATSQPVPADVAIGGVTLQGGHVNYTDNFIQPNYTADLTEITGKVGEFGTATTQPADVLVQGQVNGASPLQISGSVNPLAPMAFVDITAKADAIELTGFTPYSTKYTGYPITKGTLTVDVHYLLDQQKLSAENHIFIDQLTFGDKVQNSTATNLPIRLAVSLLKNSKGQIDLKIPISGSLNDPQFKIGAVILQVFENLIVKAATSPFSLIASAFGSGNQQLDFVVFKPGYATLTPDATGSLSTLAKGLQDRPELKLNICGRVDPALDTSGLREALLDRAIKTAKLNAKGGKNDIDPDSVTLTPEEYNKYLAEVYSAGKFEKPRDFIGIAKSIPPDQMKKLIITNTKVTDADLKNLADARANAVRQFMSKQIDPSRLFVVAPKLNADGINDPKTTTRADLMPG
ncbi:MAG TPA: DUF748 domain-containing protein, partial [Candidatus Binataceae bacterium]|nr:DUF748 domain-containing protein [Candidatus Binataceae bacterium]